MILLLLSLYVVRNKIVFDSQTQVSGKLAFKDNEQDISLWFRPQPSFIQEVKNVDPPIIFSTINNHSGYNLSIFYFDIMDKELSIYVDVNNQSLQIFQFVFTSDETDFMWIRLLIHKSMQKIEYIDVDNKKTMLNNLYSSQLNMLYSWQSMLFSCTIYDEIQNLKENVLKLQNDVFLVSQAIRIFNFRQHIIELIYVKYQQSKDTFPFMSINDQNWSIQFILNQTAIMAVFNYGYSKSMNITFDTSMTNQWIKIVIHNEFDFIKCQIGFKDQTYEQNVYYKFENQNQVVNQNLFYIVDLTISKYLENYQIFVINKYTETQIIRLDDLCYQNCKSCNNLKCLECGGQLSIESNCLCPVNQVYEPTLEICIEKTLTKNIKMNPNFELKQCPFGEYYNDNNQICMECPKIQEYYCTSCLYNTETWQSDQVCEYQEIFQQAFVQFHTSLFIRLKLKNQEFDQDNGFDEEYKTVKLDNNRVLVIQKDILLIMHRLCENNYFFDQNLSKCRILQKGQQYGYYIDEKYWGICKIGYSLLNKCIKCPKNCLFCRFVNIKLICLLPQQNYIINSKQFVYKGNNEQHQQSVSQITDDDCVIENCLVCYFASCLLCDEKYIQDSGDICVLGSQYSNFFTIQINNNLVKPQFNYQQMSYIKQQLEKASIDLNYDDIIQLIVFGNNYKAMKQNELPQIQSHYHAYQRIYCLNQTQYFNSKFCHQLVPGYRYIQSQNRYVYCPNENCSYDLIYEVVIHFTNKPSIIFKNQIYLNFQHFMQSIQMDELLIQNVVIKATVYAFESPQKACEHPLFFFVHLQTHQKYKVILDFQGVSIFSKCKSSIRMDFNEVTIMNLHTSSSLQLQINSDKIIIKNCTFNKQNNLQLNLNGSNIQLDKIYIQGILKTQYQPIINITNSDQIESIFIRDSTIKGISLEGQKMIRIGNKVISIRIENISLIENYFKEQSSFISFYQTIFLTVNFILIDNMNFEKSGVIILELNEPTLLIINNLVFRNSTLSRYSVPFQANSLNLINASFFNLNLKYSRLIFVSEQLTLNNILFQEVIFFQTSILYFSGEFINITQFSIQNSSIRNLDSLSEIFSEYFEFISISIINCTYFQTMKLLNIQGKKGIITQLMISKVTNDIDQQFKENKDYQQQFKQSSLYHQDMISIDADEIIIKNIYMLDILNPQTFLNLKYRQLQIYGIYFDEIKFHQINRFEQFSIIKHLIQLQSNNQQDSYCTINSFKVRNIQTKNIQNQQFNNLTLLNLIGGQVKINKINVNNLLTSIQIYLISAFQLHLQLQNVYLKNVQNVGLVHFSSSQLFLHRFLYSTTFNYEIRAPLIKNDDLQSLNDFLKIRGFRLFNLSTPLIEIKSNSSIQILLINTKIKVVNVEDHLISVQQIIPDSGLMEIRQFLISNQQSDSQHSYYLLKGENLKVRMEQISLRNINMGLYLCINNQQFDGTNIQIFDGKLTSHLFLFLNYSKAISFQNIVIKNVIQEKNKIMSFNITNLENIWPITVIIDFQIYQYRGMSFMDYQQNDRNHAEITLQNIKIEQSFFSTNIFSYQNFLPLLFNIYRLQIFKANCGVFFFTRFNNIQIKNSILIDLHQSDLSHNHQVQFIQSELYQTNILINQNEQLNQDKNMYFDKQVSTQDVYPLQLSFHGTQSFKQIRNGNTFQVQFDKQNSSIYVPSGQKLNGFQYFNLAKLDHEEIYKSFSIILNSQAFRQAEKIRCTLIQSVDGINTGKYSNYQEFNFSDGINNLEDFVFIMNPYQNYSYLQNDINCSDYTLRFNIRILPCQLGEYLYQNICITCDVNKNLYSIIKKAQYCQIIDPNQIQEIKVGKIKLNKNYWKPSLTSNQIEQCENDQVCKGGWVSGDLSCNSSRVGALCKECDVYNLKGEGQYIQSGQNCFLCQPNFLLILKGFCTFLWIVLLTLMNYNTNKKITEKFLQFKIMNRVYSDILMRQSIDQFSIIIKIFTNYLFVIYLVQENLSFLDYRALLAINFISNPSLIITTELDCILVKILNIDIQYIQLAQSLISPIMVLSIVYFIYMILIVLKYQRYSFNLIIIITYSVYLFNQQIIIQNQIKLLSYKIISGIKWIYKNQQFQYFTYKHLKMIQIFIGPSTAILLVIPILLFFLLKFRDKRSIWCIKKYGIIYCDYKQNAYFQEVIRIYTKHIIIFLLYFLNYVDQSILIIFMLVQIYLYEKYKPYALKNINQLEKDSYQLSVFCLISIFQLIKQIPIITYTILMIVNIGFSYKIVVQLIISFKRQYRNVIQTIITKAKLKFPRLSKFKLTQYERRQQNLQKLKQSVSKLSRSKTFRKLNTPTVSMDQQNLLKIGGEIELQSVQFVSPLQEQK